VIVLPDDISRIAKLGEGEQLTTSDLLPALKVQDPAPAAPMFPSSGGREVAPEDQTRELPEDEQRRLAQEDQARHEIGASGSTDPQPPFVAVAIANAQTPPLPDDRGHIPTNPFGYRAAEPADAEPQHPTLRSPESTPGMLPDVPRPPGYATKPPPPSSAGADTPQVPSEPEPPEASEVRGMPAPDDAEPADEPADQGGVADPPTHTEVVTKAGIVAKPDRASRRGRRHRAGGG